MGERQMLLRVVDLVLLNASLLVSLTIFSGFPLSLRAALDAAKWFVTLSALWLVLAAALDVYDVVRAGNLLDSVLTYQPRRFLSSSWSTVRFPG